MDWLQIIVLSLIQGITEFLPISSSAHLVLPSQLTDWPDQGLAFDVGVHFGSLVAVMLYFRSDLTAMLSSTFQFTRTRVVDDELLLVGKLALASFPVAVVGLLAKDFIELNLRTVPVIATTTIVFGLALWWSDRRPTQDGDVGWHHALLIGVAQVLALVPGTSRSGITITAALVLGLSRTSAARFSFLLAIPTIAGAQLLLTLDLLDTGIDRGAELLAGALIAGFSAYACIAAFVNLVERTGMLPYVIYRLLLGAALFAIYFEFFG